jgi:hypothetical protein
MGPRKRMRVILLGGSEIALGLLTTCGLISLRKTAYTD